MQPLHNPIVIKHYNKSWIKMILSMLFAGDNKCFNYENIEEYLNLSY